MYLSIPVQDRFLLVLHYQRDSHSLLTRHPQPVPAFRGLGIGTALPSAPTSTTVSPETPAPAGSVMGPSAPRRRRLPQPEEPKPVSFALPSRSRPSCAVPAGRCIPVTDGAGQTEFPARSGPPFRPLIAVRQHGLHRLAIQPLFPDELPQPHLGVHSGAVYRVPVENCSMSETDSGIHWAIPARSDRQSPAETHSTFRTDSGVVSEITTNIDIKGPENNAKWSKFTSRLDGSRRS